MKVWLSRGLGAALAVAGIGALASEAAGQSFDGKTVDITPGTAVLTRTGSSHSLKQAGSEDLVVLINYEVEPRR